MHVTRTTIPVLLWLLAMAGDATAAAAGDSLLGCYALSADGDVSMRLVKQGDHYLLRAGSAPGEGDFALVERPVPPAPGDGALAQFEVVLLADIPVIGLLKLRQGAIIDGTPAESEYYFLAPQVGGFVFRRDCPQDAPADL